MAYARLVVFSFPLCCHMATSQRLRLWLLASDLFASWVTIHVQDMLQAESRFVATLPSKVDQLPLKSLQYALLTDDEALRLDVHVNVLRVCRKWNNKLSSDLEHVTQHVIGVLRDSLLLGARCSFDFAHNCADEQVDWWTIFLKRGSTFWCGSSC